MAVWFITGASRGIGAGIARVILEAGHQLVATARDAKQVSNALGSSDNLLALSLDITKPDQVAKAVQEAKDRFGRIDVLVNNAGYGVFGYFETISDEQVRSQFETNFFGTMNVTRAVLPLMRAQKSGHIFTISSGAGFIAVPIASIYSASKFAVEGWTEGMAQEVEPFGIKVMLIEPGYFKSEFFTPKSLARGDIEIADYVEAAPRIKSRFQVGTSPNGGDMAKLGRLLMSLTTMKDAPFRLAVGSDSVEAALLKAEWFGGDAKKHAALSSSIDAEE